MTTTWTDDQEFPRKWFGKKVRLNRTLSVAGRVCSHADGGYCVQEEDGPDCHALEDGDELELLEPQLLVNIREGILVYVRQNGSSLSSAERGKLAYTIYKELKDDYSVRPTAG